MRVQLLWEKNFTDISSTILDNLVSKAPSIAFLDLKKVCTFLIYIFLAIDCLIFALNFEEGGK